MTGLNIYDVPDDVDTDPWTLTVIGAVSEPCRFDREELASLQEESVTEDFECREGWRAENLAWDGVPVGVLLDCANPTAASSHVLVRAIDGEYACAFPVEDARTALLATALDGDPLSVEHGGPARFIPTGDDTDCWESIKWVSAIEVLESEPTADDTAREIALGQIG